MADEAADLEEASEGAAVAEAASAGVAAAQRPLRKGRPAVHPEELTRVRAEGPEPPSVPLSPPIHTHTLHVGLSHLSSNNSTYRPRLKDIMPLVLASSVAESRLL